MPGAGTTGVASDSHFDFFRATSKVLDGLFECTDAFKIRPGFWHAAFMNVSSGKRIDCFLVAGVKDMHPTLGDAKHQLTEHRYGVGVVHTWQRVA